MNNFSHTSLNGKGKHKILQTLHTAVKGRRRYKIRGLRQSRTLKYYLEMRLSSERQISYVQANPATGNLLVLYQPDCNPQEIASKIEFLILEYQKHPQQYKQLEYNGNGHKSPLVPSQKWHFQDIDTILAQLNTSTRTGLTPELVQNNSRQYGSNVLSETKPRSGITIFADLK